jgi:hypothetical protein
MEGYFCSDNCKNTYNPAVQLIPMIIPALSSEIFEPQDNTKNTQSKEELYFTGFTTPVTRERVLIWSEFGFQNDLLFISFLIHAAENMCDSIENFCRFVSNKQIQLYRIVPLRVSQFLHPDLEPELAEIQHETQAP